MFALHIPVGKGPNAWCMISPTAQRGSNLGKFCVWCVLFCSKAAGLAQVKLNCPEFWNSRYLDLCVTERVVIVVLCGDSRSPKKCVEMCNIWVEERGPGLRVSFVSGKERTGKEQWIKKCSTHLRNGKCVSASQGHGLQRNRLNASSLFLVDVDKDLYVVY
jgi:hypothetical protein